MYLSDVLDGMVAGFGLEFAWIHEGIKVDGWRNIGFGKEICAMCIDTLWLCTAGLELDGLLLFCFTLAS
jgi:hypothetical protein